MSDTTPAPVITRFAPSPTGFLHIGGARTALFNWLYARANGGKMVLRIEDTDRERSTQAATDALVDGLGWLGITWDGEPVSQFERADRHRQVVDDLLRRGQAYRCYATPAELDEMRELARAEKRPPRYDGRWRDRDASDAPEGVPAAIRIKGPKEGHTIVHDAVQGDVSFPNSDLDDLVLLRSDGSPTYNLAVVVDDHDMGVTQIIRGDDHLTNAARQTIIYRAMGWDVPGMAHIPLIHGASGAKMSKRDGAIGVDAYRAMGYLSEAMRTYLLRLGWSHGDQEYFTLEELDTLFSLDAVGKSAARFDFDKLDNVNAHYLRETDDGDIVGRIKSILPEIADGSWFAERWSKVRAEQLQEAMPGLKERATTLIDVLHGARFIFAERPLEPDEKAAAILSGDGAQHLAALVPLLEQVADWTVEGGGEGRARLHQGYGCKAGTSRPAHPRGADRHDPVARRLRRHGRSGQGRMHRQNGGQGRTIGLPPVGPAT